MSKRLRSNYESRLDAVAETIVNNDHCPIPGLVIMARRGEDVYQKAFGYADKEAKRLMTNDAQFRCFSMTKVLTTSIALMLRDQGLLELEAPVETYLPAFGRQFEVLHEAPHGQEGALNVPYTSFMTGKTQNLSFTKTAAQNKILVKHCLSESTGIGYDMWTDFDLVYNQSLFGHQYGVAQALRRQKGIGFYSSNSIIGQNTTLEEYCDAIAEAGYLTDEPGTFSYGLGALLLGRIIEVVSERESGKHERFSRICEKKLFEPLGMSSAAFYLNDGDPRIAKIPQLYGAVANEGSGPSDAIDVKPYVKCLPMVDDFPNTVATDHFEGPRSCDSGDTGSCMTVLDYSKFYDMLLAGGCSPNGRRILKEQSVRDLAYGQFSNLDRQSKVARAFGLTGEVASFNFGWAVEAKTDKSPHCNHWSGYANNHGRLYIEEDSYILLFPQFMASTPASFPIGEPIIKEPMISAFLSEWEY